MAMDEVAFPTLIQTTTSEAAKGGTISAAPTVWFRDACPAHGLCWLWCFLFLLLV